MSVGENKASSSIPLQFSGCHGQVKEKSTDFEQVEAEGGVMARRENEHVPTYSRLWLGPGTGNSLIRHPG